MIVLGIGGSPGRQTVVRIDGASDGTCVAQVHKEAQQWTIHSILVFFDLSLLLNFMSMYVMMILTSHS